MEMWKEVRVVIVDTNNKQYSRFSVASMTIEIPIFYPDSRDFWDTSEAIVVLGVIW